VLVGQKSVKDRQWTVEIWDWPPRPNPRHVLGPFPTWDTMCLGKTTLATAASRSDVRFWDLHTGKQIATHSPPVGHGHWYGRFSSDGRHFASISADLEMNFAFTMISLPSGDVLWSRTRPATMDFEDDLKEESPFGPNGNLVRMLLDSDRLELEFAETVSGKTSRYVPPLRMGEQIGQYAGRTTPDGRFYLHTAANLDGDDEHGNIHDVAPWWSRLYAWLTGTTTTLPRGWCAYTVIDMRDGSTAFHAGRPFEPVGHNSTPRGYVSDDGRTLVLAEPTGLTVWDVSTQRPIAFAFTAAFGVWLIITILEAAIRAWKRPSA
jgi:WD40 repeat protein